MSALSLQPFISHFLPSNTYHESFVNNNQSLDDSDQSYLTSSDEKILNEVFTALVPAILTRKERKTIMHDDSLDPSGGECAATPNGPENADSSNNAATGLSIEIPHTNNSRTAASPIASSKQDSSEKQQNTSSSSPINNYKEWICAFYQKKVNIELDAYRDMKDSFDVWVCLMGMIVQCDRRNEIIEAVLQMPKRTQESVMLLMKHAMECWPALQTMEAHSEDGKSTTSSGIKSRPRPNTTASQRSAKSLLSTSIIDGNDAASDSERDDHSPRQVLHQRSYRSLLSELPDMEDSVFEHQNSSVTLELPPTNLQDSSAFIHNQSSQSILSVDQFIESISPKGSRTGSPRRGPPSKLLRQSSVHRNRILMYESMVQDAVSHTKNSYSIHELENKIQSLQSEVSRLKEENEAMSEENEKLSSQLTEEYERRVQTPTSASTNATPLSHTSSGANLFASSSNSNFFHNTQFQAPLNDLESKHVQQLEEERDALTLELSQKTDQLAQLEERWNNSKAANNNLRDQVSVLQSQVSQYKGAQAQVEVFRERIQELVQFKKQANDIKSENEQLIQENCLLHEEVEKQKRHHQKQINQLKSQIQDVNQQNKELLVFQERFDTKTASMQKEIDSYAETNEKLTKKIAQLTENLHETRESLLRQQTENQNTSKHSDHTEEGNDVLYEPFTTELKQKMHHLEQENNHLHIEHKDSLKTIERLSSNLETLQGDNTKLKVLQEEHLERINLLTSQIESHNQNSTASQQYGDMVDELRSRINSLKKELTSEQDEKENLSEQLAQMERKYKQEKESAESLQTSFNTAQEKFNLLATQLEQSQTEATRWMTECKILEEQQSQQLQPLKEKNTTLEKRLKEQSDEICTMRDTHKAELSRNQEALGEYRQENQHLKDKVEKLHQDLSNLYETNQAQQETIQKYKHRLFPASPRGGASSHRPWNEENIDINNISTVKLLKDRISHLEKDNDLLLRKLEEYRQRSSQSYSVRSSTASNGFYKSSTSVPSGRYIGMPRATPRSSRTRRVGASSSGRRQHHVTAGPR